MLSQEDAEKIVLANYTLEDNLGISWRGQSPCGLYWAFGVNDRTYLETGDPMLCRAGDALHLVHCDTGALRFLHPYTWTDTLEDERDYAASGGLEYALVPEAATPAIRKKHAQSLREYLNCSVPEAWQLMNFSTPWLQGPLRVMKTVQSELAEHGVPSQIITMPASDTVQRVEHVYSFDVASSLRQNLFEGR